MKRNEVWTLQAGATKVTMNRPGRTVGGTRAALRKVEARLALMNLDLSKGGFSLGCASMRASDRRAHLLRHRRMYVRRLARWAARTAHEWMGGELTVPG